MPKGFAISPWKHNPAVLLQGRVSRRHLLQIHGWVVQFLANDDNLVATRLIGHYPADSALKVFDSLRNPKIFPFNAIIRVLAKERRSAEALVIFRKLKFGGVAPNDLTFSFLLNACSGERVGSDCVEQVHSHVMKSDYLRDCYVCHGLITAYDKGARNLQCARQVFDEMLDRSLVSCWTSLISGYARRGLGEDGLQLFFRMLKENLRPENNTMVSVLSSCSSLSTKNLQKWADFLAQHANSQTGFADDYVNISLIYLFGKSGKIRESRDAFDKISDYGRKIVLVWNTMISAYFQNGLPLDAIAIFKLMMADESCCSPNHVTMVSVLSACAEVCDLDLGIRVHEYLKISGRKALVSSNVNLATSLIDMYSKCGDLQSAWKVFGEMHHRDVVSYNAMITGLATNGEGLEALRLFSELQALNLAPDSETFLAALQACNHSGLVEQARDIFRKMIEIPPRIEHYACFIDVLCRSGFIEEALDVAASMPFHPSSHIWSAVLSGSLLHNRLEMAETIAGLAVGGDSGGYVLVSNSLASDNRWREVAKMRGEMRERGIRKQVGRSWISVGGVACEFVAGSSAHVGVDQIVLSLSSSL